MFELNRFMGDLANTENVFLFLPNLIGYTRILLALFSFWLMPSSYALAATFYLLSGLLDAVDGYAARRFGQRSRFGAMLDLITDMCNTMCLLTTLSTFYPSFIFLFQLSMTINIASHWLHTHTSLLKGAKSHKSVDPKGNMLMQIYYTNRTVLFSMVAGNELFYTSLYLVHFFPGQPLLYFIAFVTFPVAVAKTAQALLQGYIAANNLVEVDIREREQLRKDNLKKE